MQAQIRDFVSAVYGSLPLMFSLIALITLVLLMRAFRSLLLPLKAVLLNLLSLAAAWGVLVLLWQQGHDSKLLYGIPATGAITFYVPLLVFAFLFGLSMDYEVFILSRIREEYDRSGSTNNAVVTGLARTGRLVTSAALIPFLAFLSLASGPETEVKSSPPRSPPASSSTPPSSAPSSSPPSSASSATGTGGSRPRSVASCAHQSRQLLDPKSREVDEPAGSVPAGVYPVALGRSKNSAEGAFEEYP